MEFIKHLHRWQDLLLVEARLLRFYLVAQLGGMGVKYCQQDSP